VTGDRALDILLRAARIEARLSQAELAARAGVTRQAISAVETGKAVPTTAVALCIARVLGRRVEDLFRLADDLPRVAVEVIGAKADVEGALPRRVQVATIQGSSVAWPLSGCGDGEHLHELVGLAGMEKRRPSQLSGGQQQRVALARALIVQPRILLLDGPFSALDSGIRQPLRMSLLELQHTLGFRALLVTHDPADAAIAGQQFQFLRGQIVGGTPA